MSPMADFSPPANPAALHDLSAGDREAPHGWRTHVIQPGETLLGIALRHRTTTGVLVRRNNLPSTRLIRSGTRIEVPRTSTPHRIARHRAQSKAHRSSHQARARHRAKRPARTVHTMVVRPGETVSGLALRWHTSQTAILKANGMTDARQLWAGQRIRVPGRVSTTAAHHTARPKPRGAGRRHPTRTRRTTLTVRPGDTVSGLAARLGVSQTTILRAAGITDPRHLQAGQTLHLRRSSPAPRKKHHTTKPRFDHNTFEGRTYSDRVVRTAARQRTQLAQRALPSRTETKAMIARTARRHGVDPRLALAIAYQESGWSPRQVSVGGAIGAMQVIPSTGQWASQLVGRHLDLLDPQDNITAGVVVLRALVRSADNERQAIAGYYQGLAGVRAQGMYPDTRRYVANVLYHKSHL